MITPTASGFRGLTCVPNLNGSGSMLIAVLEGPGDVYNFPLDGSQPTIELHGTQLRLIAARDMGRVHHRRLQRHACLPAVGHERLPGLLIGLYNAAANYPGSYEGIYPNPSFLIRHCNGTYDFRIIDAGLTPPATPISTRTMVVSQFPGDPAGTIYAGGFDAHSTPNHNTAWVYKGIPKGIPTNLQGQVAQSTDGRCSMLRR